MREGKTGIKPASASVPLAIKREMWGVGVLNGSPNRKPSEETKGATGRLSLARGRATRRGEGGGFEEK